ncbi:hypothetical protein SB2_11850 [Methylobacterium radiotolerans]|nr:hypothetical protein SB3_11045 [Methylobacterium radiotolerans]KTS47985.1 hypothetical protein SB2_11850 [Methylobacterium radiotolerans]
MRVDSQKYANQAALHALGAHAVADVRDKSGALIAFDLTPDVDLNGYDDAVAAQMKVVPFLVTKAQAKIQLRRTPGSAEGKTMLDDVVAAVKVAGGEVEIWFDDAQTWERANPYVAALSGPDGLKLTSDQVDELFIEASKIST